MIVFPDKSGVIQTIGTPCTGVWIRLAKYGFPPAGRGASKNAINPVVFRLSSVATR